MSGANADAGRDEFSFFTLIYTPVSRSPMNRFTNGAKTDILVLNLTVRRSSPVRAVFTNTVNRGKELTCVINFRYCCWNLLWTRSKWKPHISGSQIVCYVVNFWDNGGYSRDVKIKKFEPQIHSEQKVIDAKKQVGSMSFLLTWSILRSNPRRRLFVLPKKTFQ